MKKLIIFIISLVLTLSILKTNAFANDYEMRGAWITTVYNTDWPSENSQGNMEMQKKEFITILDGLKSTGINTVLVQVRPKGDALYKSNINPWSDVLTGVQSKSPGYDPLEFMIQEAHKRGIKIHAWFNPYRITTKGTDLSKLSENHPARKHQDWVIYHNGAMYYNPELKEVQQHIISTVEEVVKNYDIDGVHFDDYFYPQDYPLPVGEGKDGNVANKRREYINNMIKGVKDTVKNTKPNVEFGISPSGIWKNRSSDKTGSDTSGNESYYSVYADTRTWIKNNWIDYVVPQLYWNIDQKGSDYKILLPWWSNEVKGSNVDLYIGQGIYKDSVAKEIDKQVGLNRTYSNISGSLYYATNNILKNNELKKSITTLYTARWIAKDSEWYYLDSNGYYSKKWKLINGVWYYFESTGKMKTGWLQSGDTWYYLKPSGAMAIGWEKVGSTWYYFESTGKMKTGWLQSGDTWYYLKPSGAMAIGWEKVGSTWYYFESTGKMKTGWLQSGDTWYYLKPSGAMAIGWEKVGSTWYYFESTGKMKTGWLQSGDIWYYLKPSGAMAIGWEKVGSTWYYFYSSGYMAKSTTIDGWNIDNNGVARDPNENFVASLKTAKQTII